MKTIDNLVSEKSIFGLILAETKAPIISTIGATSLDVLLVVKHGDRLLTDKVINNANNIIKAFCIEYSTKLEYLEKLTLMKFDIESGTSRRIKETIKTNADKKTDLDEVDKVSSFNDDLLVDNTGRNSLQNENSTGDSVREFSEEKASLIQAFNNLQLLDKNNIMNTIVKDVAQYISLSIY